MSTALIVTGSQTIGPFFKYAITWRQTAKLFDDAAVVVSGTLFDGQGLPVTDGFLELWQQRESQRGGEGFARVHTDAQGGFVFGCDARPVFVSVFARGLLSHFSTRLYFAADEKDTVLKAAGARSATMLATSSGSNAYRWDVQLGGARETVFLDL
ncbi:MAG: protocatechuate 3,4-dioxygenase subunit alpha [Pseudomonadota bacterium]|jgi:protocatechuate 3,4-dioxygenase alpha subunit